MQIFDGRQLKEAVEMFGLDIKCSNSLSDWYLTVGFSKNQGAIFLNWELPARKVVDLFLKHGNNLAIDFYTGDIDLVERIDRYGPWVSFETIDFWELTTLLNESDTWHVRYLLHVQTEAHLPTPFQPAA
jgi:hypothetical protein